MLGITTTNARVGGFRGKGIDADATTIYNRIIADGGVSNVTRLNFFVKGLKAIYGDLANVPVCYDAHWIGYKLGSGTGATAGQAAAKLYSLTVAGDAIQATAASQPLLLAHNGASSDNYWWGSGVSGNYNSTPNAVANQITGDMEFIAYIDYKNNATFQTITSKIIQLTGFCYGLFINASNQIYVSFGNGASETPVNSTASLGATYTGWIKVSRVSSTGLVSFATSSNPPSTNISSISFSSFGTPATSYIGALGNPNNTVQVGTFGTSQLFPFSGKIYRATISNSIGGTPVVDFNPATYNASTSQTAWTSSTGEIWTISTGTTADSLRGVLVDRTKIQGLGTTADYNLKSTYNRPTISTSFVAGAFFENEIGNPIYGPSSNQLTYALSYYINGVRFMTDNSNGAAQITATLKDLFVMTFLSKTLGSNGAINNGTIASVSGVDTGGVSTGVGLLKGNQIFNSLILSSNEDTTIQRTATYNLLKTLNNL
jgi:hypothetical protein